MTLYKTAAFRKRDVIRDGGNSVDAAVAGVFCGGLYHPHNAGIGGGLAMTIYQDGEVHTLNARSMAPHYVDEDMFGDDAQAAQEGPFSMCIPGAVMGLWEAYQLYGSGLMTWSRLIEPSIDMCYDGIEVGSALRSAMEDKEDYIKADPGLRCRNLTKQKK